MIQTSPTSNFNRADMAAMLSAMTREEQQWTLMYLNSITIIPQTTPQETVRPLTAFRGFCSQEKNLKALRRRAMKYKFGL